MSKRLTPDTLQTIDLPPAADLGQGAALLLMGRAGAVVGQRIATGHVWADAAMGVDVGTFVATFLRGLALMLTPPPARLIEHGQSIAKYRILRHRLRSIAWIYPVGREVGRWMESGGFVRWNGDASLMQIFSPCD